MLCVCVCVCVCVCPVNVRIKQTHWRGMNPGLQDRNSQMILSQCTSGELKITPTHTYAHMAVTLINTGGDKFTQTTFHRRTSWLAEELWVFSCRGIRKDFLESETKQPERHGKHRKRYVCQRVHLETQAPYGQTRALLNFLISSLFVSSLILSIFVSQMNFIWLNFLFISSFSFFPPSFFLRAYRCIRPGWGPPGVL